MFAWLAGYWIKKEELLVPDVYDGKRILKSCGCLDGRYDHVYNHVMSDAFNHGNHDTNSYEDYFNKIGIISLFEISWGFSVIMRHHGPFITMQTGTTFGNKNILDIIFYLIQQTWFEVLYYPHKWECKEGILK